MLVALLVLLLGKYYPHFKLYFFIQALFRSSSAPAWPGSGARASGDELNRGLSGDGEVKHLEGLFRPYSSHCPHCSCPYSHWMLLVEGMRWVKVQSWVDY